jgi:hypothetical protein
MHFRAQAKDGKLEYAPATLFKLKEYLQANEGRWFILEEDKEDRSSSQLRMYRAWLRGVAAQTGNDEDELHSFLIEKCAPVAVVTIQGKKGQVEVEQKKRTSGGTTLSMGKEEMSDYMNKCAALTGYPLPTEEELAAMGYLPQ